MNRSEPDTRHEYLLKIHDLTLRLEEARETLQAIRNGSVDAVVVSDGAEERVYTLRSADSIYRILVEALSEGALTLSRDGTVMYCNARFAAMVGTPLEKILGSAFDRFLADGWPACFEAWRKGGEISGECRSEVTLRAADGSCLPGFLSISRPEAEEACGLSVVVITDLTELRQAQESLKKANEELEMRVAERTAELTAEVRVRRAAEERAERLNSELQLADRRKDEFLAMLAHELRTPLGAITSAVQFMLLQGSEDPRIRGAQEAAARQVRHMGRLLDDLLDLSRISGGTIGLNKERVELAPVVTQAIETVSSVIRDRNHLVKVNGSPEPLYVQADCDRLVQMVVNLLNNAAKYTPANGLIQVSAGQEGDFAVIRVRDNGMGIPPDILPHIFDMFMRADHGINRRESGLGIGLTLVKRLAEMHGGTVSAQSAGLGHGSEFELRLPLA